MSMLKVRLTAASILTFALPLLASAPANATEVPDAQSRFVAIAEGARNAYQTLTEPSEADFAAILAERDAALCALMEEIGYRIDGWTGELTMVFDFGTGRLVQIALADRIWVSTQQVQIMDNAIDTLVTDDHPMAVTVDVMARGAAVTFSGRFVENAALSDRAGDEGVTICTEPTSGGARYQLIEPNYWIDLETVTAD